MNKFRKRFCLPREQFMELVQLAWNEQWFPSAEKKDCTGQMGHPLELMLLGALWYLGRGFAFDDLEEARFILEFSHHNLFPWFHWNWVNSFVWLMGPHARNSQRIDGLPAWIRQCRVSWLHGFIWYNRWWSWWLESMRKDVECTFGILKRRWQILMTGIRLHSSDSVTKVWKTCCALHNWLLEVSSRQIHHIITSWFILFSRLNLFSFRIFFSRWVLWCRGFLPTAFLLSPENSITADESFFAPAGVVSTLSLSMDVRSTTSSLKLWLYPCKSACASC